MSNNKLLTLRSNVVVQTVETMHSKWLRFTVYRLSIAGAQRRSLSCKNCICARVAVWRLFTTIPTPCISMVCFEYSCNKTRRLVDRCGRKTNKQIHPQAARQTAKQKGKRAHKTIATHAQES